MKKYLFGLCFISIAVSAYVGQAQAQSEKESISSLESISNFQTDINVRTDGTIHVVETIDYNFRRQQRHGIARKIPLTDAVGTFDKTSIYNLQVVDENDTPYVFTVEGIDSSFLSKLFTSFSTQSNTAVIKIGDERVPVSGQMTYVISYDVKNALGYFDDRTEI